MREFYKEAVIEKMRECGVHFFHQETAPNKTATNPHVHDTLEIILVTEGSFKVSCDAATERAEAGDLFFFRSNCIHSIVAEGEEKNSYYVLKLDPMLTFSLIPEKNAGRYSLNLSLFSEGAKFIWRASEIRGTAILAGFDLLAAEEAKKDSPAHDALMRAGAFTVISGLIRELLLTERFDESLPTSLYSQIYMSMRYVNEHFADDVSAEWMASYLNISYSYFSRSFVRVTGMNFRRYLNLVRVRKAAEMLVGTNKSVTEAATLVGFNSVSHFIATYKSIEGKTPGKRRG